MPISITNAGLSTSLRQRHARSVSQQQRAIERLGTGKRINQPSDDPAGFVAAEQLRGELTEIQAELRTYDLRRLSLRESGSRLATIQDELIELEATIVEATGDQIGEDQRQSLQQQIEAALETFAYLESGLDPSVLSRSAEAIAASDNESLAAQVGQQSASVASARVGVGASLQQLDAFEQIARDREVIVTETLSQVEDADFAEEAANLATAQVQAQAASAALIYSQQTRADLIGSLLDRVDDPAVAANGRRGS